ncbi:MAG: energy transducer TonB [Pseudomonadota bacterium]
MSALAFSTGPDLGDARAALEKLRTSLGPLAMVLLAHAILFYFIYAGLLTRLVDVAMPQPVMVSFVAPEPPKTPPPPKTEPMVKLAPPVLPSVPVPVVQVALQPNVISVTHAPPPPEKAAPVLAAPVAPPAPAPVASGPKTITSGVTFIQEPQPVYPQMSKRMGEQGKVVLRILVNEKGAPDQVTVQTSSGFSRLDEAGRQAAMRALFKPHVEDGRAVPVYVLIPLNFQLS